MPEPMIQTLTGVMRTPDEYRAFLKRRYDLMQQASIRLASALGNFMPQLVADELSLALFRVATQDVSETLDFIDRTPQTEYGYGQPSFTADDLIKASEEVQQIEEMLGAMERAVEEMPPQARALCEPQLMLSRNTLKAAREYRHLVQKAIESQEEPKP